MPLSTSHNVGSEILFPHLIIPNTERAVASLNVNVLPGQNKEDQKTVVHIKELSTGSATQCNQGSPGLTS